MKINRRDFFTALGATTLAGGIPAASLLMPHTADAAGDAGGKLLFTFCCTGGASMLDAYQPVAESEVSFPVDPLDLNTFPDSQILQPSGSNLRVAVGTNGTADIRYQFLQLYYEDMLVMTNMGTSVNHGVAQVRALNGAGVDDGRTIMEAMAVEHGKDAALANLNMAADGYVSPGTDPGLPSGALAEVVNDPFLFGASTSAHKGQLTVPQPGLIDRARGVRNELDDTTIFGQTFQTAPRLQRFLDQRRSVMPAIEDAGLIDKTLFVPEAQFNLADYGLQQAEDYDQLAAIFPNLLDPISNQTALAWVMAKHGASVATTIGPGFGTPGFGALAFDDSHGAHRNTQATRWASMLVAVAGLIELLKVTPWGEGTMWDESIIYFASDFGRTKDRPTGSLGWGTGHDLNTAVLMISPLLAGNTVFGGVDPQTCMTYGFNASTGAAHSDPAYIAREGHIYSTLAQALGIDFPMRIDMDALMA